ncbi:MAG: xanthine dehydrogenase family protein subunit M [Gemmatimonadetes bacterium]|nr:xanthine dehydrogenase family protein subunit M [Gemmatimonadota bacterium]
MKPAPFAYHRPQSVEEATGLLAQYGAEAKVLAGGQSLIPAMNFRLARPAVLIDLNGVAELSYIRAGNGSGLRIGAMTRQRAVERSGEVAAWAPLLHEAMPFIAHPQIRNRGTVGGSLAHADPAAELPAVALALNARCRVLSRRGTRTIGAGEFYTGLFSTALSPDEVLVEVEVPPPPRQSGWAFTELARRHGDYALVGIAVHVTLDQRGQCAAARIALLSVGDGPVLAVEAARALPGQAPSAALIREAADAAATRDVDPPGDIHATAAYRRHLVAVLARRALARAFERAAAPESRA